MGTPPLPSMILTFVIAIGFALEKFAANPITAMQTYRQISFAVNFRAVGGRRCMIPPFTIENERITTASRSLRR
jgi:hypothetical protein